MDQQIRVRVQRGGRITVPKAAREALGLKVGDSVYFVVRADGAVAMEKSRD